MAATGLGLGLEDPKYACVSAGSITSPVPLRKYLHQSHGENRTLAPGEVKHSSKIQWVFWGRIRDKNQDPQGFFGAALVPGTELEARHSRAAGPLGTARGRAGMLANRLGRNWYARNSQGSLYIRASQRQFSAIDIKRCQFWFKYCITSKDLSASKAGLMPPRE